LLRLHHQFFWCCLFFVSFVVRFCGGGGGHLEGRRPGDRCPPYLPILAQRGRERGTPVPLKAGGISISRHCNADQRSGDCRSPLRAVPHRAAAAGRIRGGQGLPTLSQRPADKRQIMSFALTAAAFPRVARVPWAITVCCKRQEMSFAAAMPCNL
jgi:hypothetical protein